MVVRDSKLITSKLLKTLNYKRIHAILNSENEATFLQQLFTNYNYIWGIIMSELRLRAATKDDMEFLFVLANENECRINSFQSQYIVVEEHEKWYNNILSSDSKSQYILMDDNIRVGQGRLEHNGRECRLSYSIVPERRGYGYGKILVSLLLIAATKEYAQCKKYYGDVLIHNIASQRIFEELGFKYEVKDTCLRYFVNAEDIHRINLSPPPPSNIT